MVLGLNGGVSPPGGNFGGQNFAIVGGTGAFLGAGGQQGGRQIPQFTIPPRAASITEDPANRRLNGGGRVRWLLAIIPMVRPEIVTTNRKALILHAGNSTPVTGGNPATPGETLSLIASGLGPTVPSVDFGEPFPSSPPAVVNSPLEVTVNGTAAEVLTAIGLPGQVDTYQIQFRVPAGTHRTRDDSDHRGLDSRPASENSGPVISMADSHLVSIRGASPLGLPYTLAQGSSDRIALLRGLERRRDCRGVECVARKR